MRLSQRDWKKVLCWPGNNKILEGTTMTEKDKELIKKAWDTDYIYWSSIDKLMEQAETSEAKEQLKSIRSFKYHQEEAFAGTI